MKSTYVLIIAMLSFGPGLYASKPDPVIQNVVQRLKQDVPSMQDYGAHQRIITTRLSEDGKPTRIEEKTFRTVWIHNKAQNELVNLRCQEIDPGNGKSQRCRDYYRIKYPPKDAKPNRIESEIKKVRWTDLHRNFVFTMLPPEGAYHVISFRPREGASPTNRIEKLLSRMVGKIWVDRQFNVVKAEAKLMQTVSFGLGIAARVHHLAIRYKQQEAQSVWLPSSLVVDFKAKVALVHNERQRIEVVWSDPYRKSDAVWAHVGSTKTKSTRR